MNPFPGRGTAWLPTWGSGDTIRCTSILTNHERTVLSSCAYRLNTAGVLCSPESPVFQAFIEGYRRAGSSHIGAQKAAEEAQKVATEKVKQYQDALKQARTEIYLEQEAARKKVLDERAAQLKEARAKAAAFVNVERERIKAEVVAARREIESSVTQFAALVARRVLQSTRPPNAPSRESR